MSNPIDSLSRANQIIHEQRAELIAARTEIEQLKTIVADEVAMRYSLYKRIAELTKTQKKGA